MKSGNKKKEYPCFIFSLWTKTMEGNQYHFEIRVVELRLFFNAKVNI